MLICKYPAVAIVSELMEEIKKVFVPIKSSVELLSRLLPFSGLQSSLVQKHLLTATEGPDIKGKNGHMMTPSPSD